MDRWWNKVAIVTGASVGIGAAIAAKLVEEGLQVVGLARRVELVEQLSKKLSGKSGKLYAFKADMTKEDDILEAFKWTTQNLGPVHILVNNAGVGAKTSLSDGDTEKWRKIFETNVIGLCIATREAVRIMKKNNIDGHIIHINSVGGHKFPDAPDISVYPASKHAVVAISERLRQELHHCGSKIKVSSISPGVLKTDIYNEDGFNFAKELLDQLPSLKVDDVANAVVYILATPPHLLIQELIMKHVEERI